MTRFRRSQARCCGFNARNLKIHIHFRHVSNSQHTKKTFNYVYSRKSRRTLKENLRNTQSSTHNIAQHPPTKYDIMLYSLQQSVASGYIERHTTHRGEHSTVYSTHRRREIDARCLSATVVCSRVVCDVDVVVFVLWGGDALAYI